MSEERKTLLSKLNLILKRIEIAEGNEYFATAESLWEIAFDLEEQINNGEQK